MAISDHHDPRQVSGEAVEGHRIGHLVAQQVIYSDSGRRVAVMFRCDCGRPVRIKIQRLKRGQFRDACSKCWKPPKRSHGRHNGLSRQYPSEYKAWHHIKDRARGLWRHSFEKFIRDMGPKPPGKALLRYRPKEPYCPSNCYWGDKPKPPKQTKRKHQNRTKRRKQRQEQQCLPISRDQTDFCR